MKALSPARWCAVGVCFETAGVSLAVRRKRRICPPVRREFVRADAGAPAADAASDAAFGASADDYRAALSALVAQEKVAGARCTAALPVARCRVQWTCFTGARLRDLRAAAGRSAFWQAHLGVTLASHRVWWRFIRAGGRVNALLAAAPRADVDLCAGVIRAAGLSLAAVGVSCFDYFDGGVAPDAAKVTLVLDCDDACVVAAGAFGVRARAVGFNAHSAAALRSGDPRVRDGVVDGLAVCVRRCVEDAQAAAHADVRVVAPRAVQGDWLAPLRAQLPGFVVETADGWAAAGLAAPDGDPQEEACDGAWRLPRAAARLARATRGAGLRRRGFVPAVNFAQERTDGKRRLRRLLPAAVAAGCLLGVVVAYAHWLLLAEHRRLQPDAERHAQLVEIRDRAHAEIKALQNRLSHRVLFYSGIQRVSFERKLMPRLLASIEHAALEGVWLNAINFRQSGFLQITGKSLDDERITRFIGRLRAADEITDVFLESATVEVRRGASQILGRRLKDFVITCHLQAPGEAR